MKRVTTNISAGQVFFILFTLIFSSLMFFYLGAKFGPRMLSLTPTYQNLDVAFMPDEKQAEEIKTILKESKYEFLFFHELQGSKPVKMAAADLIGQEIIKEELPPPPVTEVKGEPVVKPAENTPEPAVTQPVQPEKKVEQTQAEVPQQVLTKKQDPVATPEPALPSSEDGSLDEEQGTSVMYTIQLGSYKSEKKAKKAQQLWQERGYETHIVPSQSGSSKEYRLRAGQFTSLDEVLNSQKQMMSLYRQGSNIVKITKEE